MQSARSLPLPDLRFILLIRIHDVLGDLSPLGRLPLVPSEPLSIFGSRSQAAE